MELFPGDLVEVARRGDGDWSVSAVGKRFLVIKQESTNYATLLNDGHSAMKGCPINTLKLVKRGAWRNPGFKKGDRVLVYRKLDAWGRDRGTITWIAEMDRYLNTIAEISSPRDQLGINWYLRGSNCIFPAGSLLKVEG